MDADARAFLYARVWMTGSHIKGRIYAALIGWYLICLDLHARCAEKVTKIPHKPKVSSQSL